MKLGLIFGWLAQGQRAVRIVGGRRGPNFTIILAISNIRGSLHHQINQGGTMAEVFNEFLAGVFQEKALHRKLPVLMNG